MKALYSPTGEAELAVARSLLDAEGITYFIHNDHFGSLRPGPYIPLFNAKTIMVADDDFTSAKEVMAAILEPEPASGEIPHRYSLADKIRMVCEVLLFTWIMPGPRRVRGNIDDEWSHQ